MLLVPRRRPDGTRRYGSWAGCPEGLPEETNRCIAEVQGPDGITFQQCYRPRGHGPRGDFCRQHAKKTGGRHPDEGVESS